MTRLFEKRRHDAAFQTTSLHSHRGQTLLVTRHLRGSRFSFSFLEAACKHSPQPQLFGHACVCVCLREAALVFQGLVKVDLMSSESAHQIRGQQGLEVQEQPGAGDLLQPAPAGVPGLLEVLGVRAFRAGLPARAVELNTGDRELSNASAITRALSDDERLPSPG